MPMNDRPNTPPYAPSRRAALCLFLFPGAFAACALNAYAPAALAQKMPATHKLLRIVSVNGAMTEIVYALGAGPQLAGSDTTSVFPAAALQTPKVGYMRQLSAEGLLSLKPDAVIGTTEAGPAVVMDQIRSAGVKVELVEADHSWLEVRRKVAAVGRATSRIAQATALQASLDAQWAAVLATVARHAGRKPRAIFILSHTASPQVAGGNTAAHAMLAYAGFINAFTNTNTNTDSAPPFTGYRPMTAEALVSAAPEVIVTTTQGIEASGGLEKFWSRPGLALTPAYKRRALVALDALYLIGFGPRLPQAVAELHQAALKAVA
jgi:iron complex transport system substrate-binding protein